MMKLMKVNQIETMKHNNNNTWESLRSQIEKKLSLCVCVCVCVCVEESESRGFW